MDRSNGILEKQMFFRRAVCAFLLAVLLLSAGLMAVHETHECSGENCPICSVIAQIKKTLDNFGAGFLALALTGIVLFAVAVTAADVYSFLKKETLISRKVRLDD